MASKRVGSAHIEFSARTAKVVSGMDEAKKATRQATLQMKKDVTDAKQTLALLGVEAGVHLPRQLRGFVAQLPGVASAMSAAFTGLAVIGLGKLVIDAGMKVYRFAEKAKQAAKEFQDSFAEMSLSTRKTSTDLDLVNDKLGIQIAKLEHKPANLLKLALDEDRQAALGLTEELTRSDKALDDLMKKGSVSAWGQILSSIMPGKTRLNTSGTEEAIHKQLGAIIKASQDANEREDQLAEKGGTDADRKALRTKNYTDQVRVLNTALAEYEKNLAAIHRWEKAYPDSDRSHERMDYEAAQSAAKAQIHDLTMRNANADAAETLAALEQKKVLSEAAKGAAAEAKAAREKQYREQIQGFEEQLSDLRQNHQLQVGEEEQFWRSKRAATERGSLAWLDVNKRIGVAHQQTVKTLASEAKQDAAEWLRIQGEINRGGETIRKDAVKDGALNQQDMADSNKLAIQEASNEAREKEAALTSKAGRSMTEYAAAVELAKIHSTEFDQQMFALKADLSNKQAASGADPTSKSDKKALDDAKKAVEKRQSERNVQTQQDMDAVFGRNSSGLVGAKDALFEFVRSTQDNAATMRQLTMTAISTVNDAILKGGGFKAAGASIFHSAAKSGLEKAEGKLINGLMGKNADGKSESTALWVRMSGGLKGLGNQAKSGLAGLIPGPASSSSGAGGFMAKAFSFASQMFIPHAAGGPVSAGTAYMVGEHGPEPFFPGVSGTMATNAAMRNTFAGSGGGAPVAHYTVNVGNGVSPEEFDMKMGSALRQFHPQVVRSSVQAMQERSKSMPSSKR